jgi:hypothetical protein
MTNFSDNDSIGIAEFDVASFPCQLQEIVEKELEEGETIEWIAQPVPRFFKNSKDIGGFLFSICTLSLSLQAMYMAFKINGIEGFVEAFIKIFDLVFFNLMIEFVLIFIGMLCITVFFFANIWMLLKPFLEYQKMLRTVYAITDRRTIIFEGTTFSFNMISYKPAAKKNYENFNHSANRKMLNINHYPFK